MKRKKGLNPIRWNNSNGIHIKIKKFNTFLAKKLFRVIYDISQI